MKKLVLTLIAFVSFYAAKAQTRTPGPAEIKLATALCDCLNKLDQSTITDAVSAQQAFMNCFMQQIDLAPDVAKERGIDMEDKVAMRTLGKDISMYLLKEKCAGFVSLATKMAQKKVEETTGDGESTGIFKRIDNKGFNYITITVGGQEKSFLWFRQFAGSEYFNAPAKLVGKKITIKWHETEAYLPAAKGYYNVKEITAIEILK